MVCLNIASSRPTPLHVLFVSTSKFQPPFIYTRKIQPRFGKKGEMGRKRSAPSSKLFAWVRRQSTKVKTCLAVVFTVSAVLALKFLVGNHLPYFFVAAEAIHFTGILVLIYKLTTQNTCSGISLKSQELTAIFLSARLCCSFLMEGDIHTLLDFLSLVSTLLVIYMIRFKLKSTYNAELDNIPLYYVAVPCAILALPIHPFSNHPIYCRMLWAFAVYLESVSVLPQLRMMQNTKMIEPYTAHYVFALGVARFLGCAHWIIKVYNSAGGYLFLVGIGYLWIPMVLLAEVVQTFILADFCYYYVKSAMEGQLLVRLPMPV